MRHALRALVLTVGLVLTGFWSSPAAAQEWTSAPEPVAQEVLAPPVPAGWVTEHGPFLRVHGAPEHYATVLRVARHASEALPELARQLAVPIGDTIHVYVTRDDAEFRAMQPGTPPLWADATAYPKAGAVFLRAPKARGGTAKPIEQVMDHELAHVLLGRAFGENTPPTWLQEGIAQVLAGEYTPQTTKDLAQGMLAGELFSIEGLSYGFPSDPLRARLAYAQSADFIQWLQVNHGEESLGVLVQQMAAGKTVNAAVYTATGSLLEDVDRAWRGELADSGLALSAAINVDALYALGGVALLIGGVLRRREFHRRLEAMGEEERLLDELWLGREGASASGPRAMG